MNHTLIRSSDNVFFFLHKMAFSFTRTLTQITRMRRFTFLTNQHMLLNANREDLNLDSYNDYKYFEFC